MIGRAFLLSILFQLTALMVPVSVSASPAPAPKSFAVFVAFYNTHDDVVRGGVCGTVFFVSPTEAITAHHVLKAESFKPAAGFERVRVWLVHENSPAIEVKAEYVRSNAEKDLTQITLPTAKSVDSRFVFAVATAADVSASTVETDGFVANTAGPTLARVGQDIEIVKVPKLERLHLSGSVLQAAVVNIKASDIDLKSAPNLQLSYEPVVGISGGPVIADGKVIAMNSFADPATRKSTWALRLISKTN